MYIAAIDKDTWIEAIGMYTYCLFLFCNTLQPPGTHIIPLIIENHLNVEEVVSRRIRPGWSDLWFRVRLGPKVCITIII